MEDRILEWLESQGYPLEMEVAKSFQDCGFRVIQGEYYSDPDSATSRETDVVASMQASADECILRVSFITECKSLLESKPWILFTRPTRLALPARVAQRAASESAIELLLSLAKNKEVQTLPLFEVGERAAYAVTQAFTTGKDITYEAVLAAAKAAAAIATDADDDSRMFQIALPIVVTRARLFDAFLGDDNKLNVCEVDRGTLLWRNPVVGMPHTIVPIMRFDAFKSRLQALAIGTKAFIGLATPMLVGIHARSPSAAESSIRG